MTPGVAIDLSSAVTVGSRRPPHDRFLLTDVRLIRASPLRLAYTLWPGVTLERADAIVPSGSTARRFEDVMQRAMMQSQSIAAVVAERAAGLRVPMPAANVEIEAIDAACAAGGLLAIGDVIRRVDFQTVRGNADVRDAIAVMPPGTPVRLAIDRAGRARTIVLRTVRIDGHTRLGLRLGERFGSVRLAIPVRYEIGDVGGSSGGLMMALRIYESFRAPARVRPDTFAGTGTIALDGRIGPIEGTRQKLIAAKHAGARVFFVPRANYVDISSERDLRVVPVDTFAQAVRALDG